jgi:hypothetical protein
MSTLPFSLGRAGRVIVVALAGFGLLASNAHSHGGVVYDEDVCVLNIGFLMAHFTGYQPETRGAEEFCEDIPEVAESVFVIDYLHDFMKEMPVDFRIIKDVQRFGQYAKWDDIQGLDDIERDTIFYLAPEKRASGTLTASYRFEEAGGYIGIVTARHPTEEKHYNAVFFFQVGGTDYGYLPIFVALIVLLQIAYLAGTGTLARFARLRIYPLLARLRSRRPPRRTPTGNPPADGA